MSFRLTLSSFPAGHVAHGKSQTVKAISGVHTVRFKNELERNITIKLGYANAKVRPLDPAPPSTTHTVTDRLARDTDLQVREPELRAARKLPLVLVGQGGPPAVRGSRLRRHDEALAVRPSTSSRPLSVAGRD